MGCQLRSNGKQPVIIKPRTDILDQRRSLVHRIPYPKTRLWVKFVGTKKRQLASQQMHWKHVLMHQVFTDFTIKSFGHRLHPANCGQMLGSIEYKMQHRPRVAGTNYRRQPHSSER